MPYKDKEKQKEFQRNHYKKYKNKFKSRLSESRKRNKKDVDDYKNSCPCEMCGENELACKDLHHERDKDKGISWAVRYWGPDRLKKELDKCIVLCVNCHRKLHWKDVKTRKEGQIAECTRRRRKRSDWFEDYKSNLSCSCGENHPSCIDFHHRDSSDKFMKVSDMVCFAYKVERILEEIEKCDVMCANCHRKYHHGPFV